MAGRIVIPPTNPSFDSDGQVVSGALLYFYANTTTTLQSVYSDATLATPLANPLSSDAAGRFPEIWGPNSPSYSVRWVITGESDITYNNIFPGASTIAGQIAGTTTNDSASAGNIGEYGQSSGSIALADNVAQTVTSVTLQPGDYDVWCNNNISVPSGATLQYCYVSLSLTAATTNATIGYYNSIFSTPSAGLLIPNTPIAPIRYSFATATNIYLVAVGSDFAGSTDVEGLIYWRRVR